MDIIIGSNRWEVDLCKEHRRELEQFLRTLPPDKRKPKTAPMRGRSGTTKPRGGRGKDHVYDSPEDVP